MGVRGPPSPWRVWPAVFAVLDAILPYSKMPEYVLPGVPLHYATSAYVGGDVVRFVVETNDGRPTKIEGNGFRAEHHGGSNSTHQGTVLDLYDPQRLVSPMKGCPSMMPWCAEALSCYREHREGWLTHPLRLQSEPNLLRPSVQGHGSVGCPLVHL